MSFGFSVGDFLAVLNLVNTVRKQFKDAPGQFKSISDDPQAEFSNDSVKLLSNVLRDIEDQDPAESLRDAQKDVLNQISRSCGELLDELRTTIDKCQLIEEKSSVGTLELGPERNRWVSTRLSTNIDSFNLFLTQVNNQLSKESNELAVTTQYGRHEECLNWLSMLGHDAKQADFFSRVQEGTGNWLLNSTEFHNWIGTNDPAHQKLDSNTIKTHRTLFCPGMPGAGKTFLASIVINHLQQVLRPNDVALAFFFCNFREKVTLDEMLATLLKQLVRQQSSIPRCLTSLFERRARLTTSDIITGLKSASSTFFKVFIVIDALDECYLPDNLRKRFLLELRTLQETCDLHEFATSRDNLEITTLFEGCSSLGIRANPEDVKRFLSGRIGKLPSVVQKRTDLQEEIITEISKAVDGMFLLARLHIDSLQGKRSVKSIRQALKTLPIGLDASYTDAMSRIESQLPDEVENAKEVICWIYYATRSLTPLELQHALAIEDYQLFLDEDNISDIEDLISVCAGLVTVDDQSGVIRLVHHTTQEYFDRNRDSLFPDAHHRIATRCIHYLSFDTFNHGSVLEDVHRGLTRDNPLLEYSASSLRHHITLQKVERDLILGLLRRHGSANFSEIDHSKVGGAFILQLHLAACLNHVEAIEALFDDDERGIPETKDHEDETPLSLAIQCDFREIVKFIIGRGFSPYSAQGWFYWQKAFVTSIKYGHDEITWLLGKSGVDIKSRDRDGVTPLGVAAENGNYATARYIIEQGAIAHPRGPIISSPLGRAALNGHEAIFDFLAEIIDDSPIILEYHDLFCCAALGGSKHIMKHLLDRDDIPMKWKVSYAQDALHGKFSCDDGSRSRNKIAKLSALEILLAIEGVDVNFQCNGKGLLHKCTDLTWQVFNAYSVIKLLCEHGVDPNIRDKNGHSCLFKAVTIDWADNWSFRQSLEIAKLLVNTDDPRADLESKDQSGRTALHCAVISAVALVKAPEMSNECEAMIRLLLDRGAGISNRDNTGKAPLFYAAQLSHVALVQMFLSSGAGADDKDSVGRTPLSYAVGFDPQNLQGIHDEHSTQFSIQWPPASLNQVVEILLLNGADPNVRDHEGMTPLLRAEKNLPEDHEVLKMLRKPTNG
ncbi:unnamed protein product [Penicillium pancosmium]